MKKNLPEEVTKQIADIFSSRFGFRLARSGKTDLEHALAQEAKSQALSCEAFAAAIINGSASNVTLEKIAEKLTIGETYFFRHPEQFQATEALYLRNRIAQKLEKGDRTLRIWSAACSTGEEAYSLAMLAFRSIPDRKDWKIEILGTDLAPHFLETAKAGEYGEWSFRGVPEEIKKSFFEEIFPKNPSAHPGQRLRVKQEIKDLVNFSRLNLKARHWLIPNHPPYGFDVVFCRNVLIYFDREIAAEILWKIKNHMAENACLVVSPSELALVPQDLGKQVRHQGASIFLVASGHKHKKTRIGNPAPAALQPRRIVAKVEQKSMPSNPGFPLDPTFHYLAALEALEKGDSPQAYAALTRTLYLDPDFIPAHIALGNAAGQDGRKEDAVRHLSSALKLLASMEDAEPVQESGGMSAKALRDMVESILAMTRGA
jgi:chemotaxis protein methyltransferase CheR